VEEFMYSARILPYKQLKIHVNIIISANLRKTFYIIFICAIISKVVAFFEINCNQDIVEGEAA